MTERTWLMREVLRRVVAFFALGVASVELSVTIAPCFGALQVGLVEAALPFRGLARLLLALGAV